MRNERSASRQRRRWPHSRSCWIRRRRHCKRWSQSDTQRWSPVGRRKRQHISLHQRERKKYGYCGCHDAPMVITGQFTLVFSSVNECLFSIIVGSQSSESQRRASSKQEETQVEVYLCSLTASGPWTVRLASPPWLWSLEPASQFEPCLQPSSVWTDYRRRKLFMHDTISSQNHNCALFLLCEIIDKPFLIYRTRKFVFYIIQLYTCSLSTKQFRAATNDYLTSSIDLLLIILINPVIVLSIKGLKSTVT